LGAVAGADGAVTSGSPEFVEDLPQIAADAYELSARLCGECRNQHALWTYLRLTRASTGVEKRESQLEAQLSAIVDSGARDILIAGCQDTGLLALVARATFRHRPKIIVLDICETPLELCRRFARQWSLPIETVRQDLVDIDYRSQFDLVLMHGTLNFVHRHRQPRVMDRLREALRAGGKLVLLFNTGQPVSDDNALNGRKTYASFVLSELTRLGIALPDHEAQLQDRLIVRARQRELRDASFSKPEEVESILQDAGFHMQSCTRLNVELAKPVDALLATFSKQRFMAIAEPNLKQP
jgi:SAM-dependent methyltransferase